MKSIFKCILILVVSFFICNCKTPKLVIDENNNTQMYNLFEANFTKVQFDSICIADTISNNLEEWHKLYGIDGDTEEKYIIYMYIKSLDNNECIYRLIDNNGIYKITKRIKNISE